MAITSLKRKQKSNPESTVTEPSKDAPHGKKGLFDALLRQAVPDEATPPKRETSDPE